MDSAPLSWKLGVEVELMAPPGRSRRHLAEALAAGLGGTARPFFHAQGEPSKVPGTPVFENLTHGFRVDDGAGGWLAECVDDLTLQADLDRAAPPAPGWYRIVSDDPRLLRFVMRHADPAAPLERVLDRVAELFGTSSQRGAGGMVKVTDVAGAPIALAAPLPGERERPCELITPPLAADHAARLEALLAPARDLGFTLPAEGATHLHFDAAPLERAATAANLVRFWRQHAEPLKRHLGTNPRCVRLGEWPGALFDLIETPGFSDLAWPDAQAKLRAVGLTKYCDLNLRNLVHATPGKHTVELRVLPAWIEAAPILAAARAFEAVLLWAQGPAHRPVPADLAAFLGA